MDDKDNKLRIFGIEPESIVDGPGIRYVIFLQGCNHACPGCHNKESHDPNGGYTLSTDEIYDSIQHSKSSAGVTFSGGEPLDQIGALAHLAVKLENINKNIWCYTGYIFEDLYSFAFKGQSFANMPNCIIDQSDKMKILLENIDVLVDGPFVLSKKSYSAKFRGSTNQRLIDVSKSLKYNQIVLYEDFFVMPQKPDSW